MDKAKKKQLQKLSDKCKTIINSGINDHELDYLDADYHFHIFIAKCSNNTFLYEMIERIHLVTKRFHILSGTLERYSQDAIEGHDQIVNAIMEDRYEDAAAMEKHIQQVGLRILVK